jgi:hypothetical protein
MNLAVLLLIFNRPVPTAEVMKRLADIRPTRLYVAADGPRPDRDEERELCEEARRIACAVTWPCEVRTLWRDSNLGCKRAVSSAIDWFFGQEMEGVILEDDCVPHPDFFIFCKHGLERYRYDERVYAITGDNFQAGRSRASAGASYYFSKYPHCWGWASWRRAWTAYDGRLGFWDELIHGDAWASLHSDPVERRHWEQLSGQVRDGALNSWAIPWMFSVWNRCGLTMTPDVNMVTNIGFDVDATHTVNKRESAASLAAHGLNTIQDPAKIEQHKRADRYVFLHHFGGRDLRFPRLLLVKTKRFIFRLMHLIKGKDD